MSNIEIEETLALVGDLRDLAREAEPGETEAEAAARLRLLEISKEISERLSHLGDRLTGEEGDAVDSISEGRRFEALGRLTAEVGHRLNNLLAALATRMELVDLCLREGDRERVISNFDLARNYLRQVETIAVRMIDFSGQPVSPTRSDLNEIVRGTVSFTRLLGPYENIEFVIELAPDLAPVTIEPARWQQLLLSLISNGADAIGRRKGEGGRIRLITENIADEDRISLTVRDEGRGVASDDLPRLFEPGFTTKGKGRQGLGLTTCKRIAESADGTISVESKQGEGTTVTITLPTLPLPKP